MRSYIVCGRISLNLPKKLLSFMIGSSALADTLLFLVEFILILVFNLFSKQKKITKENQKRDSFILPFITAVP